MKGSSADSTSPGMVVLLQPARAMRWVTELFHARTVQPSGFADGDTVYEISESARLLLLGARVPGAGLLDGPSFQESVARIYRKIDFVLRARSRFPIRFWNYIPRIGDRCFGQLRRYELFNAGRFSAFHEWYGAHVFNSSLPSASAVGNRDEDLVVFVLADETPGIPIENPRQKPAYTYSRRFGPVPPCFARATLLKSPLDPAGLGISAIVSGTASVTGEDTVHVEDLNSQIRETMTNLASISRAVKASSEPTAPQCGTIDGDLLRYRELRVYVRRHSDVAQTVEAFQSSLPALRYLEVVNAELCRRELLVEAEGAISLRE